MIAKMFEVRDAGTFIPVLAVKLCSDNEGDRYLLARSGYGSTSEAQATYVQVSRVYGGGGQSFCDPYDWPNETMRFAHDHIIRFFDTLEPGAVIDVEYILGKSQQPKQSERYL